MPDPLSLRAFLRPWELPTFNSLRFRDYRLLWIGSVTEHGGEWMERVGRAWLVWQLTGSPFMLGIIEFSRPVVSLFVSPFGGVIADRVDRRKMLMATFVAMALSSLFLAVLVYLDVVQMWHIVAIEVVKGMVLAFNHPARASILPNVVPREHLMNAVALDTGSIHAFRGILSPLAGFLIFFFGVGSVFGMRAIGSTISLLLAIPMKVPPKPPATRTETFIQNLGGGFRYLRENRTVLALFLLYIIPLFLALPYIALLPVFADRVLHVENPETTLGYLYGAEGWGALIAIFGVASLGRFRWKGILLFASAIVWGIMLLFFSFSTWLFLSFFLLIVVGAMNTTYTTVTNTLVQSLIPDEVRGRVMSIRQASRGLTPLGSLLIGGLALFLGAPLSVAILGGLCAGLSLLAAAFFVEVRRLE